jgi:hypothetical protein
MDKFAGANGHFGQEIPGSSDGHDGQDISNCLQNVKQSFQLMLNRLTGDSKARLLKQNISRYELMSSSRQIITKDFDQFYLDETNLADLLRSQPTLPIKDIPKRELVKNLKKWNNQKISQSTRIENQLSRAIRFQSCKKSASNRLATANHHNHYNFLKRSCSEALRPDQPWAQGDTILDITKIQYQKPIKKNIPKVLVSVNNGGNYGLGDEKGS